MAIPPAAIGHRSGRCLSLENLVTICRSVPSLRIGSDWRSDRSQCPNRDAIVSRVIWLRGMEQQNAAAHDRCIYIHGTPEARNIGKAASFGCIRMRSRDIIALYD
jgi:L,D-transpeptidase-like protein